MFRRQALKATLDLPNYKRITMKNPMDVLRIKEQEIARVKKEIDALRIAAQLCGEESQPSKGQPVDLRKALDVH
jgi:hypothetical protein